MSRPPTAQERQRLRTSANLWRALIPLLVLIGFVLVLAWPRPDVSDQVHVVDTAGPIAAARQQGGFAVLVPTVLPPGWQPTSTEFLAPVGGKAATLRIGYVTASGQYAEFVEGPGAPDGVSAQYGPLLATVDVQVNGTAWQGFQTSRGRQLLRHTSGGVTVAVTGSASQADLTRLAESLS